MYDNWIYNINEILYSILIKYSSNLTYKCIKILVSRSKFNLKTK